MEYRYDYKRYIVEKRKETYQDVEKILTILATVSHRDPEPVHRFFAEGRKAVLKVNQDIVAVANKGFWLSDEIVDLLKSLNLELVTILKLMYPAQEIDNSRELGKTNYVSISRHSAKLRSQYFQDIRELDNIRKFKNKRHFDKL